MSIVTNLESQFATWYSKFPHLPLGMQKWLANNVWWLALLVVVLSILGVATILLLFAFGSALIAIGLGINLGTAVLGGLAVAAVLVLIAMGFWFVIITLTAFAIPSLRARRKKGWRLLFIVLLLYLVLLVSAFVFTFEVISFITGLLTATVMGYVLFEIREYFTSTSPEVITDALPLPPPDTAIK